MGVRLAHPDPGQIWRRGPNLRTLALAVYFWSRRERLCVLQMARSP